jgi:GNAT superfamily N-acetyltransferase
LTAAQGTQPAPPPRIRPATVTDLDRIWDIRFANDFAGQTGLSEQGPTPAYLAHLQAHGFLLVAERDDRLAGYAGLIDRGGVAYLTDLFVDPAYQSTTVGRRLLEWILPTEPATRCTLASTDHRALALYTRAGMAPRWPILLLEVPVSRLREISSARVEMLPADLDDPELHRRDHAASGRWRPLDLAFMVRGERGQVFWFTTGGDIAGYGIIRFAATRPWRPGTVTIGPIGSATAEDARASVLAAVEWTRSRAAVIEMAVPGPHPALKTLLAAGFRIASVETYCASVPDLIDPSRYLGSGGDLF